MLPFVGYLLLELNAFLGQRKKPDAAIIQNYNDDDYSQVYSQIKEAFRVLTKNDILQPYISDDNFRSSKA